MIIAPMATKGEEPVASMGNDAALAVLSDRQPPLFAYFKQLFAQVTNPPIDPLREKVVMSLQAGVGAEVNLLTEVPEQAHMLVMDQPILRNHELEKLRQVSHDVFDAATLDITWPIEQGPDGMELRLYDLCAEAARHVEHGANILILSDRNVGPERVAMPSLLAVAAVHHHLVRRGTRLRTGLVIESGEPRDIHHMATLIGYGAAAINPYLMFESLDELADRSLLPQDLDRDEAEKRIVSAIGKGLMKTLSKMGISTIQSYCGAQIFEAVGLERELIDEHFTGTASRIGGVGLDVLSTEAMERHFRAYPRTERDLLPVGGVLQWRRDGELHVWSPDTIAKLQHAVRGQNGDPRQTYQEFAQLTDEEATRHGLLRGLMELRTAAGADPAGAGRAGDRDRQAVHDRGDEPRRAQPRGPRDARDRDEPDGRAVEHRRRWRGPRPLRARRRTATCGARRSSRSPRAVSASRSTTWSTPISSRSRWPRAPSPARAGSSPATRSTTTSRGSATRLRASA